MRGGDNGGVSNAPDNQFDPGSDSWGGETDWSLIDKVAGRVPHADRERAWRDLVARYKRPVLRSLKRQLRDEPSAEEAADEFFSYLFQKHVLFKVDPHQGRFRCYIQGVIRRYAKSWRRSAAASSAADIDAVDVSANESSADIEREEELAWAEAVLEHALERTAQDSPRDAELLSRAYGLHGATVVSREDLARERNINANAMHVAMHRARSRLYDALMAELRPMVATKADLDAEKDLLVARLLDAHPGILETK